MTIKKRRKVRFTTDQDGKHIVLVPLANQSTPAKLLLEDFKTIIDAGYTSQWTANSDGKGHAYVRCGVSNVRGQLATVARLIMDPPFGYRVTYRDGDRLNLRRDNLKLEKGARLKGLPDEDDVEEL